MPSQGRRSQITPMMNDPLPALAYSSFLVLVLVVVIGIAVACGCRSYSYVIYHMVSGASPR
jgi:hypothetical protein